MAARRTRARLVGRLHRRDDGRQGGQSGRSRGTGTMTAATSLTIFKADTDRACGDCQLCCKLLPMPELDKPANTRCQHQKFKTGCAIYTRRPRGCMYWSCRWLLGVDTADVPRPDRAHYVIDPTPDFIRMIDNTTGELQANIEVVQVWID